jgi:hypothetical protein
MQNDSKRCGQVSIPDCKVINYICLSMKACVEIPKNMKLKGTINCVPTAN